LQTRNQNLERQSKNEQCLTCGKEISVIQPAPISNMLCPVCLRKSQFDRLPAGEKIKYLLGVIPPRYIGAEIEHIAAPLQNLFENNIETGVYLWGNCGSGKTYSMAALAKMYLKNGYIVKRFHYEMLCLQLRDTFNPKALETELQVLKPLLDCDKLFIEDVGATRAIGKEETDHSRRTLLLILDMRLEQNKPTFITGNKSIENLQTSFDERISDRIKLFDIYAMSGKSKRLKQKPSSTSSNKA
jgi:hypothetical protein